MTRAWSASVGSFRANPCSWIPLGTTLGRGDISHDPLKFAFVPSVEGMRLELTQRPLARSRRKCRRDDGAASGRLRAALARGRNFGALTSTVSNDPRRSSIDIKV